MSPPVIEKQPNGEVTGVSYYTLYEAQRQEAAQPPYPLRLPSAVGEYRQKYVHTSEGWRISELKIISVFKNKA